jgi:hypothetical protein
MIRLDTEKKKSEWKFRFGNNKMKVFWFSRHPMSPEQRAVFGPDAVIHQVNGSAPNVHVPFTASVNGGAEQEVPAIKEQIKDFDVVAIVAPINLQQQFLAVAGDKPVIFAKNDRVRQPGGEFEFIFAGWERLVKIEVITEPFVLPQPSRLLDIPERVSPEELALFRQAAYNDC